MSAEIVKWSGAAFCLAPPIVALFVVYALLPQGPSTGVVRRSSSVTKTGNRIYRERFNLESPIFSGTATPSCSIDPHPI